MKDKDKTKEQPIDELVEMRKQINDLQESNQRFSKIFEYSNDAIFLIDPDRDEILEVNPKAGSMLGYSRKELLSIGISDVHPGEMPKLQTFAQSVFEQGHGWTNELVCLTKTKEVLPCEISASIINVEGRRCIIAMVRDITERKQVEEALQVKPK